MKKKINVRLILIAVIAVLSTAVSVTMVYYTIFEGQVRKDLRVNAQMLADTGVFDDPQNRQAGLAGGFHIDRKELRVTWIDADGTVLYDEDLDSEKMSNHGDRPEFKEALENGEGQSVRHSETMNMNTYYYALRLKNGTVLRVSTQAKSGLSVLFSALPIIVLILDIIVCVCVLIAHMLTNQLLQPIEQLADNIEDTTNIMVYKELVPFVNTIREQHENILMAAKVRQDFTANVSHELKTPLTAISGYAELIENHMVDPEQESRFAKEIQQNATRLLSLINDIIRLSELDSGADSVMSPENFDLNELVKGCLDNLKVNAQKHSVTLHYEGEKCMLRADRGMITEMVENLCQNAIRYNNEGGSVTVCVFYENDRPVFEVKDNGIGIPKDQTERVFERFYRVDKSRSKQTGGTGLGLAIVKQIVELHDAEIRLQSELGKGTDIRVLF